MCATRTNKQCPNCHGWYSNMKGFKHHIRHCRRSIDAKSSEQSPRRMANPILSMHSSLALFRSNGSDLLSDEERSYNNGDMIQTEDSDKSETKDTNDVDSCFLPLRRKTMAVTKFQVMLNDLLLKHKANLLLMRLLIWSVPIYHPPISTDTISSNQENLFYNRWRRRLIQVVFDHLMVLLLYTMALASLFQSLMRNI